MENEKRKNVQRLAAALIVAVVAFAAHWAIESFFSYHDSNKKQQQIQAVFDSHCSQMNAAIDFVSSGLATNIDTLSLLNQADSQKKYSLYLFVDNQLRYWHHAQLPNEKLIPEELSQPIIKTENGYYYARQKQIDNYTIVALFRVQEHYFYNNAFLSTRFDESLRLDSQHKIIETSDANSLIISNPETGEQLLAIAESNEPNLSVALSVLSMVLLAVWFIAKVLAIILLSKLLVVSRLRRLTFPISFLLLLALYSLTVFVDAPPMFTKSVFFSPQTFAFNTYIPSLMSLLVVALLVLAFCFIVYINVSRNTESGLIRGRHLWRQMLFSFVILTEVYLAYLLVSAGLNVLVMNSSDLTFYASNIDISVTSITKMSIIALLGLSSTMIMDCIYAELSQVLSWRRYLLILLCFTALATIVGFFAQQEMRATHFLSFTIINIVFFAIKRNHPRGLEFGKFVWFLFLLSLCVAVRLSELNYKKEHENRELLANNLAFKLIREDDPVAEQLLVGLEKEIAADTLIFNTLAHNTTDPTDLLYSHIREKYFSGYFTKYNLQVVLCEGENSSIQLSNSGERHNCFQYFQNLIDSFGERISEGSKMFMLNDNDGRPSYFGSFYFHNEQIPSESARIFVELNANEATTEVGYPELLTNTTDQLDTKQYESYSYAFYFNQHLISQFGDYQYASTPNWITDHSATRYEQTEKDYSHLVMNIAKNQCIVLSYPNLTPTQFLANYSFIFIITFIVFTIVINLMSRKYRLVYSQMTLHERIQSSMAMFFMIVFVAICMLSGQISYSRYKTQMIERVSDTHATLMRFLYQRIGLASNIESPNTRSQLNGLLTQASSLLGVDAHIYSPQGQILGSSKHELFVNGIVSPLINSEALERLRNTDEQTIILTENIGKLTHFSLYAPIINNADALIGYINIPTFYDVKAVHKHLFSTLLPFTYAYLIIMLMAIGFSFILANGITKPLNAISNSIKQIGLQKKNEKLFYPNPNDEIGLLVAEHNRMIDELVRSAEKLAASERESTWREMARQIAHEIKNPLTPMKLNVQYLLRAWDEQRSDFGTFIHRVGKTLVEQIDQLAFVASEFSGIAKIQNNEPQRVDVAEKLSDCVLLFDKSENATVLLDKKTDKAFAYINAEQLTSVFNNLIKNALQAARPNEMIVVKTSIETAENQIHISVSDNGKGIPSDVCDKIFRPNFTTKSQGMGLGLAIVKAIIANANGDISFETEEGCGTTFRIVLPKVD